MRSRVLVAGVALSIAACSQPPETEPQTPAVDQAEAIAGAIECVGEFMGDQSPEAIAATQARIDDAVALAGSVTVEEAHEVASFLRTGVSVETQTDEKVEAITVQADTQYNCEFLNFAAQSNANGVFFGEVGALVLINWSDEPISDLWGGLMTLHEGRHARLGGQSVIGNEERDTRVFEQAVVSEIGGAEYQAYLDDYKAIITNGTQVAEGGFVLDTMALEQAHNQARLDGIFGPTTSENDSSIRTNTVTLHALFQITEEEALLRGEDPALAQQLLMNQLEALSLGQG